ncbi:MAG: proline dehydrogenase [Ramalina farinacea]|uniref:Proline dehydrogenase n=1 Tax=Ramalina farinacea TaxID=258253 RepID=A0AA43QU11_9LECA|nr:proline dehydrogenase [Ramalina farinacea]
MDAILQKASDQNCRVWIDAEQQYLQHSIESWTIDMMRKWNRAGKAVVCNTIQAYLKSFKDKLAHQLNLAHQEGWTLAIKLVRGAYIENDIREHIHDNKADTDHSYDSIVETILSGRVKGVPGFSEMQLFLAGHNPTSVAKASQLVRDLQAQGRLKTMPDFGQLQGMADQLGCELLQHFEAANAATGMSSTKPVAVPGVYKCMTWATIQECKEYLVRRVVGHQGATSSVTRDNPVLVKELRRRAVDWLMGRRRAGV